MRVALVSTLPDGGPVEHSLVLAKALTAAGAEVLATCATAAVAGRFAEAGADARVLPLRHQLDAPGALRLRGALRGVDVVHAQDRRAGLWTRALPRPRGAKLVYTIHGLPDPYLPTGPRRPGLRAQIAYRGVDAALGRRADALITPSRFMADTLVRRLGLPASRLHVVPNAVEAGETVAGGDAVGTVSSLEPVKGLGVLLDAFAALGRPGLRLLIFGTGSQAAELAGRGAELPGFVPAREALARLRVFVLPSLMENFPMALLEAMAAGVPAVASRVGGVPEAAPPGAARLVPPGDPAELTAAIAALLDDPDAAREQAARARAHVEAHASPAVMAARTLAVYGR